MKILSLVQYVSESFPVVIRQISLFVFGPAVLSCCHRNISFWNYSCREIAIFILSILLPYWMILFHYWYYMSFVAWTDLVIAFYQSLFILFITHAVFWCVCVYHVSHHKFTSKYSLCDTCTPSHYWLFLFEWSHFAYQTQRPKSMFLLLSFQLCLY